MKAPQDRKTKKVVKRVNTVERTGLPDLVLDGTEDTISLYERGEDRWPPTLRNREEIELLRDWCQAWLDADEQADEADEADDEADDESGYYHYDGDRQVAGPWDDYVTAQQNAAGKDVEVCYVDENGEVDR